MEIRKVNKECKLIQFHTTVKDLVGGDIFFVQIHMSAIIFFVSDFRFLLPNFQGTVISGDNLVSTSSRRLK